MLRAVRYLSMYAKRDPYGDGISSIECIPAVADDLTVVNAARVSFSKHSSVFTTRRDKPKGSDEALIDFLADHNHWTPIAQPSFTFKRSMAYEDYEDYVHRTRRYQFNRVKLDEYYNTISFLERGSAYAYLAAECDEYTVEPREHIKGCMPYTYSAFLKRRKPVEYDVSDDEEFKVVVPDAHSLRYIMEWYGVSKNDLMDMFVMRFRMKTPLNVARQLFKSVQGVVYNEESRRYISKEPEFYIPESFRYQDPNVKQGSSVKTIPSDASYLCSVAMFNLYQHSLEMYEYLINKGVCNEQARLVLSQGMYTEFVLTGTAAYHQRVIDLRTHPTAQYETRRYAEELKEIVMHPDNPIRCLFVDEDDDNVEGAALAEVISLGVCLVKE